MNRQKKQKNNLIINIIIELYSPYIKIVCICIHLFLNILYSFACSVQSFRNVQKTMNKNHRQVQSYPSIFSDYVFH